MEIRKCTVKDVDILQMVCRQTFAETFLPFNTEHNVQKYMDQAYSLEALTKDLQDADSVIYLAFHEGEAVGHLKLNRGQAQTEKDYPGSMEIHRIYVLQDYKRLGIGKQFMDIAFHQAKEWQVDYIWLGVWEHNEPALKFYKKMGFKPFRTHIFTMGDKTQTDYILRKEIAVVG